MGVANGLAYVYTFSSTGFRQLFLAPSAVIYEKLHEMKAAREELEEYADIKYLLGNPDLFLRLGLDVNEVN
jgi:hypothetical protein